MQTKERFTFAGLEISRGPVFFHQGKFVHPESFAVPYGWKINSYEKAFGKTDGSTYFNWNEVRDINLDGWRLPTKDEWEKIVETSRRGAVYNGKPGSCFALIQVDVPFAGRETCNGVLLFPDDAVINGIEIGNINQCYKDDVSELNLNVLLKQGCMFLPASGCYDSDVDGWYYGGNEGNYWSSTQNGTNDAWCLEIDGGDVSKSGIDKSCYYCSVRLVRE